MNEDSTNHTERKSVKLSLPNYNKIKYCGKFGESLNDVVGKVFDYYIRTHHKNSRGKFDGGKGVLK